MKKRGFTVLAVLACAGIANGYMTPEAEAQMAICQVLENMKFLLLSITAGLGVLVYIPILIAAGIIHLKVKGDSDTNRLLRMASKVMVVLVPVSVAIVVVAVYAVNWVFTDGQC
ncbi:MAG: hypothetical protein GF416_02075 [Candidatus Altiarchaeales archaeon]|nr:hypothetical protein [Candidatus Altiarchaeales archaeon]MBD3415905.1 hypothetical protein [Candidatus Altiarchaeales archaeon]